MSRLPVDEDAIRALARILTETGLTEIEVSAKESRIRVARAPASVHAAAEIGAPAAPPPGAAASAEHPGTVSSPMVGVAYLSAEPGSPPYVSQGQLVSAGQVLLLIEAMKTFNQIKAPRAGVVSQILVASGTPVEYGQALMVLEG